MDIAETLSTHPRTISFEFFPPKDDDGHLLLGKTIGELAELQPDFISVTYGAGGSTRQATTAVAARVQAETGIPAMTHFTCVGSSVEDIARELDAFHAAGINGIVALRGDPPADQDAFHRHPEGFGSAQELIAFIHQDGRFSIGCAAYPDGHPETPEPEADWDVLIGKFDRGADLAITQCFFDVAAYRRMMTYVTARRPDVRIVPGILPVLNFAKLRSFCQRCGAVIPPELQERFVPYGDDPKAMQAAGLEFTIGFCEDLLHAGAPGLHIYSLNRSAVPIRIVRALRERGVL